MLTKKQYILLTLAEGEKIIDDESSCRLVSDGVFFNAYKDCDDSDDCVLQRNRTVENNFQENHIDHITNILSNGGREYVTMRDGRNIPHQVHIKNIHCVGGYLYLLWSGLFISIDKHFNTAEGKNITTQMNIPDYE